MRNMLVLEINEVPWKLLDRFKGKFRHIDKFFDNSHTLTNVAVDSGELSPWITWPTFHRGMPKEVHGIKNLGQDPSTFSGVPIWEEYRNKDYNIGLFGSLQSWPASDPGDGGFFVPDTFAHDAKTVPASMEQLQEFNLALTALNKRTVSPTSLLNKHTLKVVASMKKKTLARAGLEIAGMALNRQRSARMPIFQGIIMWDAFKDPYNPVDPPAFSTFFTNHVASMMHRFWADVFPEDFGREASNHSVNVKSMEFALRVVDTIIGDAMSYSQISRDLIVVFASSMGQDAIHRDSYEGAQLLVKDVHRLFDWFKINRSMYTPLLAMAPQTAVRVHNHSIRQSIKDKLEECFTVNGNPVFTVDKGDGDTSLCISTRMPPRRDMEAGIMIRATDYGPLTTDWKTAGMEVLRIDNPGTGYHVPEGAMAIYGDGIKPDDSRRELRTDRAKEFLLNIAEL
jgi:hypothetical protein